MRPGTSRDMCGPVMPRRDLSRWDGNARQGSRPCCVSRTLPERTRRCIHPSKVVASHGIPHETRRGRGGGVGDPRNHRRATTVMWDSDDGAGDGWMVQRHVLGPIHVACLCPMGEQAVR